MKKSINEEQEEHLEEKATGGKKNSNNKELGKVTIAAGWFVDSNVWLCGDSLVGREQRRTIQRWIAGLLSTLSSRQRDKTRRNVNTL